MKVRIVSGLLASVVISLALMSQPTAKDEFDSQETTRFSWSQSWLELRGKIPVKKRTLKPTENCRDRIEIGKAESGKKLYACQILGSSDDAVSPVLVVGTMHGDEPAGMRVTKELARLQALSNSAIWVIDDANPDGRALGTRQNRNGVDLNRNFPEKWQASARGTRMYSGKAAASESETRALMFAINELQPKRVIIFHQPYDQVDCLVDRPNDLAIALADLTGVRFKCIGGEMAGSPSNEFTGTYTMWIHKYFKDTTAVTFELGADPGQVLIERIAKAIQKIAVEGPL